MRISLTSNEFTNTTEAEAFDDFALKPVQKSQKRGALQIAIVTAGYCMTTSSLFTGAAISTGLTLFQAIAAALIGNLLLAIYSGLIGAASAKHGVSTTMLARHAFGRSGAKIISTLCASTLIGWYAVQTGLFGETLNAAAPSLGMITSPKIAALWGGFLMMLTAYIGYRGIEILSKITIPALFLFAIWGIHATINQTGGGWDALFAAQPTHAFPFTEGVVLVVGSFAVGAVVQPDISRYAKDQKAAWIASIAGYIIANGFMIIAGVITSFATGSGDLPEAMVTVGLRIPALIILIAAQWTTNDNNLYSASLALSNIFKIKKSMIVLFCGVLASLLGFLGVINYFIPWLNALGILIPPIAGVMIADYYIIHQGNYQFGKGTEYSMFVWPAFIAWMTGVMTGCFYPIWVPSITAIAAAFATHLFLMQGCKILNISRKFGVAIEDQSGF